MEIDITNYTITKASPTEFILSCKGANYLVGEIVYLLLNGLKNGEKKDKIIVKIKENNIYKDITDGDIQNLLYNQIHPLLNNTNVEKKKNPVKSFFIIFKPKNNSISTLLSQLFSLKFFWISFVLLFCFSGFVIYLESDQIYSLSELGLGWGITFLFSLFIILFHEIGHVIAAIRYKVLPKEVGFGIYFIYPAFYTDLSEIWKLNKKYRIIINLAGMYFQMLINIALYILILYHPDKKELWVSMLFSNTSIMFFNLNPLFKFDGYWVYSDYFEIHNLRERSSEILLSIIKRNALPKIERKKRAPLYIYTICYMIFMVLVWFFLSKFLYLSATDLYSEYDTNKFSNISDFETIKKLLVFVFLLVIVIRIILGFIKPKITK